MNIRPFNGTLMGLREYERERENEREREKENKNTSQYLTF